MKKVLISTVVGTIIFFLFQTAMWMGGIHGNLWNYHPQQDMLLQQMSSLDLKDGLYYLPSVDPEAPDVKKESEKLYEQRIGKPWAMVFYHRQLPGMSPVYIIVGLLYSLVAAFLASAVIWYGRFLTFSSRFMVGIAFGLFALCQGVLDEMNWWSYPWSFIKPQVIDLTIGWALSSLWFAWYLKRKTVGTTATA